MYSTYIKGGQQIPEPEEVKVETKKYLEANNPVAAWLQATYEFTGNDNDRILNSTLLQGFREWKDEYKTIGDNKFGKMMSAIGFKTMLSNGKRYYKGIKTKSFLIYDDESS